MAHVYKSANSLPESGSKVCTKHEDSESTIYESFNCSAWSFLKEIVFFSLTQFVIAVMEAS